MAAVTCIIAGAALETLGARSGIVTSSTMDCLRAVPVGAIIEVIGKVSTGRAPIFTLRLNHHQTGFGCCALLLCLS